MAAAAGKTTCTVLDVMLTSHRAGAALVYMQKISS